MNDRDLTRDVAGATAAHRRLEAELVALTDEQAAAPSLLPGWTVAHALTHLARNADSHVLMLQAASRGEVGAQYPGGMAQRNADIEAGSRRSAEALRADVVASSLRLQQAWADTTDDGWRGEGWSLIGAVPIIDLPFRRWREAVVHLADLGLAYSWRDWPGDYVRLDLQLMTMVWASRKPMGLTTLPPLAAVLPDHERLAWLLGRLEVPGIDAAGIF